MKLPVVCTVLLLAASTIACDEGDDASPRPKGGAKAGAPAKPLPTTAAQIASAIASAKAVAAQASVAIDGAKNLPPCEKAFVEIEALVKTFRAIPGNRANPKVPDKALFLKTCAAAPPAIQKCIALSYASKHKAECKKVKDNMDPALKAKLKKMMQEAMGKGT